MTGGIRVARLFGINIHIDWSWIFIFLLITWQLAVAVFPVFHPGLDIMPLIGYSIAASLLFFASVLAHELAHSLMAKARGLPVRRITLFIFGGVSNIEREPPSPGTEFWVTIVGPITSLVLGFIFLFAGLYPLGGAVQNLPGALTQLGPLYTLLFWLGSINILLAVFNMIPGFPLDGGRILRSIIWKLTDNLRRATRWASMVGHAVAWLFIITGIAMVFGIPVPIFGTGLIGGLWLAFIGWFLNNAAAQSYQQVVVQDMLEGVSVSRLMRSEPPTVEPNLPISSLVYDHLMGTNERAFPVLDQGELVGMICLEDVRKVPKDEWDTTLVNQVMTPSDKLEVISPREDATDALEKISRRDINQVPVVQNGELIGLLRRQDIMRWLQLHSEGLG
jgi:Zn-dependent protease/predicted transcriptional regulator